MSGVKVENIYFFIFVFTVHKEIRNSKFEIRVFGLAKIIEGAHFRGYFYKEGYIRTSSYKYDCSDLSDAEIHLTNDAI